MRTGLQKLILNHLSLDTCRYTVDVENGVLYTRGNNGVTRPMKPRDGMVTLHIKTIPYRIKLAQLIYLAKHGCYDPNADIIHIDGEVMNNRWLNLEQRIPMRPYDPKEVHRDDITESIIRMHKNGLTVKDISDRLLVRYHIAYWAVMMYKKNKPFRRHRVPYGKNIVGQVI